jgi:response regulator RpfG family c-di-GMP phosphodiesterase
MTKRCSHARQLLKADMHGMWHDLLDTCSAQTGDSNPCDGVDGETAGDTENVLFALGQAVEQRHAQTAGHCERLAFISVALGVAIGLERQALVTLYRGSYLHDVGKVGIPDSILLKPGRLTADEWITMRSHPCRGEEICRPMKSLRPVLPIIRYHHERWNGTGYPDGLRGEQIPLLARIVQIADIYDSLTSKRVYKPAYSPTHALAILAEETKRGWRDPRIFKCFLRLHSEVIGTMPSLDYNGGGDPDLGSMSRSLLNLRKALANESRALVALAS